MNWTAEQVQQREAEIRGERNRTPVPTSDLFSVTQRKNKYGVAPPEERIVDGRLFDSKREAQVYVQLKQAETAGAITDLTLQPKFEFPMGFSYIADFSFSENGERKVVDVKGYSTKVFTLKRKCLAYFYPDVKLEVWK